MKQILLLASLLYFIKSGVEKNTTGTQTLPEKTHARVQTETANIPIKIKNKAVKPTCFMRDKRRVHKDWFFRKFYIKNKIIIFNRTDYEIEAHITPRNILSAVGFKGLAGDFNNVYERETYTIKPSGKFKIRNYPTNNYYMKLFIDGNEVSKKLYSCCDDIVISHKNNI